MVPIYLQGYLSSRFPNLLKRIFILDKSDTDGMFIHKQSGSPFLLFGISVQKNVRDDTYKINPSILFKNPFVEGANAELLLLANLRTDGVSFK